MRPSVICFLLFVVTFAIAEVGQVHVALTGKPEEMSVMWISRYFHPDTKYEVKYGYEPGKYSRSTTKVNTTTYTSGNERYTATVSEAILQVETDKTVYYVVSDGKFQTKEFSFQTSLPERTSSTKKHKMFKFLTYGDMDINHESRNTLNLIEKLTKQDKDVRFIIHQGDLPYAWGGQESKWDDWGSMAETVTANIPYMTTVGNHEVTSNFTSYKHRFSNQTGINSGSPDGNIFYSYNYASVHFVALSTEPEHEAGLQATQYTWLENDLKKVDRTKTPFVILYAHRPMYCSNQNHGTDVEGERFRKVIEPLLAKYKVDIFLYGHVHAYERTCPITENGVCGKAPTKRRFYYNNPEGTIHLVIGTAGYEKNPNWQEKPNWSVYRETSHGLMRFTVMDQTALYAEFIRSSDGTVADRFMLDKKPK